MLCIQVELWTGRYVATEATDRGEAEWPPHPARLTAALVAAWASAECRDPEGEKALRWLERQAPPCIAASPAARRDVVTVFVPVNDTAVVGAFERQHEALDLARQALAEAEALAEPARKKAVAAAQKGVARAEASLAEAIRKAVAPGKGSGEEERAALALLPEGRTRQARTFPSVCPEQPRFALSWPEAEPPPELRAALARLCEQVHRVGHSSSLVGLHLTHEAPAPDWVPAPQGPLSLRVAGPGHLDELLRRHAVYGDHLPRPNWAPSHSYARAARSDSPPAPHSSWEADWIALRRVAAPEGRGSSHRLPLRAALPLAERLRMALLSQAPDPRAPALSGHLPDGRPSPQAHLAVVPLPFVGSPHADGELKGVALLLPRSLSEADRQPIYRALGAWEERMLQEGAEEDPPPLWLNLGKGTQFWLQRSGELPHSLRALTWAGPARIWLSVTPVVLDRNPGELRPGPAPRDPEEARRRQQRLDRSYAAAEQVLRDSLRREGLPDPLQIELSHAPLLPGGRPCRDFPGFQHGDRPRAHIHAALTFSQAVQGPILIGAGRHFGMGLFRPLPDEARP